MLDKYKKIPLAAKAALWFVICTFLQKGITIITTPIFTRILTAAEYGKYNVFISWMEILTVFITLRLTAGVYMQGLVKYEDNKDKFAISIKSLYNLLLIISTLLYLLFHQYINKIIGFSMIEMLCMIVIIWGAGIFTFWSMEKRLNYEYKSVVIVTLLVSILQPLCSIVFILISSEKVLARIIVMAIISLIFYGSLYIKDLVKNKKIFDTSFWKYALLFNIPLIPHYLSLAILSGADKIMIDNMIGNTEAGIYSLAYSLSLIMTIFNTSLLQVIEPWLYKKIKKKKLTDISKISYPMMSFIAIINLFLIALAPEIVSIFAPVEYHEAIWIIPPVTMSVFFMFAYSFFATFEFYFEKKSYIMISTLTAAIANIGLNLIFINIFGYLAAGYTTLACYFIYAVAHYLFMQKICKSNFDGQKVYSLDKLLKITLIFLLLGSLFTISYNFIVFRYLLFISILIMCLLKRNLIIKYIKYTMKIREEN